MEGKIGANQRRRIYKEDDRRRQTNKTVLEMNQPLNRGGAQADISLSLGPISYPSRPTTSLPPLAPPPPPQHMTTWPSPDLMAQMMASSRPYFIASPPYLPSSSSRQSVNLIPPSDFAPPVRPVTSATAEPRRSVRPQPRENQKDDLIPPPFPWATNKKGKIQSIENLESKQITTITGDVQCKHCEKVYKVSYNLRDKFSEVEYIFMTHKRGMRERALRIWSYPEPARCELCGRDKAVKPVIAERKSQINWLFLFLGQTLGYCTLEQIKYFCKHSRFHRTGAKNRVLYLTYLGICNMLNPNRELFHCETTTTARR